MTLLLFLNCLALTFLPVLIIYKSSKLSEFGALSTVTKGALAYAVTQFLKIIVLATVLPTTEHVGFDLTTEVARTLSNVGDIAGVYFALNWVPRADADLRLLGVGLGWATAESVLCRLLDFNGARTLEFDWKYVRMAVEANFGLVLHLAFAAAVYLYQRRKLDRRLSTLVLVDLALFSLRPLLLTYLATVADPWTVLTVNGASVLLVGGLSWHLYQSGAASVK